VQLTFIEQSSQTGMRQN